MSLIVEDYSVTIGRNAIVSDVGFAAEAGSCIAVLGRNGAGKSTLVRGLAGVLPARGKVTLAGDDLMRLKASERYRRIGYVAQGFMEMSAHLSTYDMMLLALNGTRRSWHVPGDHLARIDAVLAMLELGHLATRRPAEMSGGQRQMVALALALVRRPRLLLLDEPTSALDIANQLHLLRVVRDYTRREGIVTVMVLHDLNMAARYTDRVLMLSHGRTVYAGATGDALTAARIRDVFGVECTVYPVEGGGNAIFPLAAVS